MLPESTGFILLRILSNKIGEINRGKAVRFLLTGAIGIIRFCTSFENMPFNFEIISIVS